MVLRILPLTLVAIDIAIFKILEQRRKFCVIDKKMPIESQNRKTAGRLINLNSYF